MPRSGTTLMRDLLSSHSRIRIPPSETNLVPRWSHEWSHYGDLSDPKNFSAFYRRNLRTPYFLWMQEHTGMVIGEDRWYASCQRFDPGAVFEALVRHDVSAPYGSQYVWGDKSPDHTSHLDLLARLFPDARVIHIVRDVRDYCLSLKETWGKNMIRGAQRWVDGVAKARRDAQFLAGRYLELRYEDLLHGAEFELRRCCDFLGLAWEPAMVRPQFLSSDPKEANGTRDIRSTNMRKFVDALDERTRTRIESIAAPMLGEFGYDFAYKGPPFEVPHVLMAYYQLVDSVNFVRAESRQVGFARAVRMELARHVSGRVAALRIGRKMSAG